MIRMNCNIDDIDNRFAHWKVSFPKDPINNNLINQLPDGWMDNSYHHDEHPSILWKVGEMDCCQLYFDGDVLSLFDCKNCKWTLYSSRKRGEIIDLKLMIEWYLLKLRAFEHLKSLSLTTINENVIDDSISDFCNSYLSDRSLGSVPSQYWPSEIVLEVQSEFGLT